MDRGYLDRGSLSHSSILTASLRRGFLLPAIEGGVWVRQTILHALRKTY